MLSSVFDMTTSDGVLSVLPLHHTFRVLHRLSDAAQSRRADHLSARTDQRRARARDQERSRHRHGRRAGVVGTAASPHQEQLYERSDWIGKTADTLIQANAWLRDKTPLNLGPFVFYPIHEGLGGRIRYFISGGSALSEKIQTRFSGSRLHDSRRLWPDRSFAGADCHASRESHADRKRRQAACRVWKSRLPIRMRAVSAK